MAVKFTRHGPNKVFRAKAWIFFSAMNNPEVEARVRRSMRKEFEARFVPLLCGVEGVESAAQAQQMKELTDG